MNVDIINMSLNFELKSIKGISNNALLYVEGSEAGPLCSRKGKSPVGFKITCNRRNILNIRVFEDFKTAAYNRLIGETDFSAQRFVNENKWNQKLRKKQPIEYEAIIYNEQEKPAGILTFLIVYVPTQLFMGEKIGDLESIPQKEPVRFYKGSCQTKNAFSCLDSNNRGKPFNCVETTYRDGTFGDW